MQFPMATVKKNALYIMSLRVEVPLFVLSPEIEDRNAVEVDNWTSQNSRINLNCIFLDGNEGK
jgi:hypothetical protein